MRLSPIDRRLASKFHLRQIESVRFSEAIGDYLGQGVDRAASPINTIVARAVRRGLLTAEEKGRIVDILDASVLRSIGQVEKMLTRMAHWGHNSARDTFVETIPRRWWKMVQPLLAAQEAETPADLSVTDFLEPVRGGDRIPDEEFDALVKQVIFKPLTREAVDGFLRRPNPQSGQNWEDHLRGLSGKITDPQKLVNDLSAGIAAGENLGPLTKRVEEHIGKLNGSAKRVARTEARRVAEAAQRETWIDLGDLMIGAQIQETLDQNTRPHHALRHGTTYFRDGRQPPLEDLPELPDEPNCRGYAVPVLATPAEVRNDPRVAAEFKNVSAAVIPDPSVYSQWFDQADEKRRKDAVGAKRYNAMAQDLRGARPPEWTDFIDGDGRLLSANEIKREHPEARRKRKEAAHTAISRRSKDLAAVAQTGFF